MSLKHLFMDNHEDDTAVATCAAEHTEGFHLTKDHSALIWAASMGNVELLKRLCDSGVDINTTDQDLRLCSFISS